MYRRLTVGRAIVAVAVAVAFALMSWAFAGWWIGSHHAGGDPGGRLMAKLTPLVRVVPGFESGQIPWITGGDANGDFPRIYAMKVEPRWDSCDGMAGTFGWDPALIQVGFQWAGNSASLTKYLNRRLVPRGLTRGGSPWWGDSGGPVWVGPRHDAPAEAVVIEPPVGGSDQWMALIEARPVGRIVSGC